MESSSRVYARVTLHIGIGKEISVQDTSGSLTMMTMMMMMITTRTVTTTTTTTMDVVMMSNVGDVTDDVTVSGIVEPWT